ncbi:hypothetical protein KY284_005483 [Solanum tuberosum]|nr:hypothetical protein KY284_005483 [Solanum tuberosum]
MGKAPWNQTNGGMVEHLDDLGMTQPKPPEENQSNEDGTEEPNKLSPITRETENTVDEVEDGEPRPSTSNTT